MLISRIKNYKGEVLSTDGLESAEVEMGISYTQTLEIEI
jgi:hypothetical protein